MTLWTESQAPQGVEYLLLLRVELRIEVADSHNAGSIVLRASDLGLLTAGKHLAEIGWRIGARSRCA